MMNKLFLFCREKSSSINPICVGKWLRHHWQIHFSPNIDVSPRFAINILVFIITKKWNVTIYLKSTHFSRKLNVNTFIYHLFLNSIFNWICVMRNIWKECKIGDVIGIVLWSYWHLSNDKWFIFLKFGPLKNFEESQIIHFFIFKRNFSAK